MYFQDHIIIILFLVRINTHLYSFAGLIGWIFLDFVRTYLPIKKKGRKTSKATN